MRRFSNLPRSILALACALYLTAPLAATAETYQIDQLADLNATTPQDFYRFEPNYMWINPGDTVEFLNSLGNHTVKSIDGMWPEGVEPVDVAHMPNYQITLTTPGLYAFKCKVHNRHGMFALVIVGDVRPDLELWKTARLNDVGKQVFEALFKRLETDIKTRYNK